MVLDVAQIIVGCSVSINEDPRNPAHFNPELPAVEAAPRGVD
jgi:hypothetical protein